MPSSAFQIPIASNSLTDFTEALSTNEASATVDLPLPTRDAFWFVRAINVIAVQNLAYEFQFFSSATNADGTIPGSKFIGVWQFAAMSASAPASPGYPAETGSPGDTLYHYYIDGLWIPYYDGDLMSLSQSLASAKLHVRLINRSAAGKVNGELGALQATFFCANQGMQV